MIKVKVKKKEKRRMVSLADLKAGNCFWWRDKLVMKMDYWGQPASNCMVVEIESGKYYILDYCFQISPEDLAPDMVLVETEAAVAAQELPYM